MLAEKKKPEFMRDAIEILCIVNSSMKSERHSESRWM